MKGSFGVKIQDDQAMFTMKRVNEINWLRSIDNWIFVQGRLNHSSRGCSADTLIKVTWWEGDEVLTETTCEWLRKELSPEREKVNLEKKKLFISALNTKNTEKSDF